METTEQKLIDLTQAWKEAKRNEQEWNQQRIAIESEIHELTCAELPEKGTHTTSSGMKITTGFTEEWN